jgi:TonB family protein
MRKTTFVKTPSCCIDLVCLAALGLACLPAFAQDAGSGAAPAKDTAPAAADMPTDPKALMLLAAQTNGLTGPDVRPWHVKFTFDVPGSDFVASDHGTIEEWWSNDTRYKIAIASTHFEQTEYGTDSGIRRSGVRSSAPSLITSIENDVLHPIALQSEQLDDLKIELHTQSMGDYSFSCLAAAGNAPAADAIKPSTYCLDATQPVLRIHFYSRNGDMVIFSHIVRFQGKFVARQIEQDYGDFSGRKPKTLWTAQIDMLEALKPADEKDLDPPVGTLAAAKTVTVSEKEATALLLTHSVPIYPPIAKAARVSGSVLLRVTVGTDGRVSKLSVVSGPAMLQQASIDAVKKWTFKPCMVDGDTAEMETTITASFNLIP